MAENLYCPRCAGSFSVGTAYCRSCGLELGEVANIVRGEAANTKMVTTRPNFKFLTAGVGLFILSLIVGLIFGGLREFNLFDPRYGKAIFYAFVAVAMLTIGLGFVFPTRRYSKRKVTNSSEVNDLGTSPLPGALPDMNVRADNISSFTQSGAQPASVTERTTRNLD